METVEKKGSIKCLVWDLDNTLWQGTLLEDRSVILNNDVKHIITTLDHRGILQSIASKNNHDDAMKQIKELGLENFFLYPQIHWDSKVQSIKDIATAINIGLDTIAFIDDNPAELDEVSFSLPEVTCIQADNLSQILDMPSMTPRFNTQDQKLRRQMYLSSIKRDREEKEFVGPKDEFLASLNMVLTIFQAEEEDLQRAEELTVRTNQLNATGYTYSYDQLNQYRCSDDHLLFMATLTDKYGSYGHIGLALLECSAENWVIKLLLMSCRVMSRGVGSVLLNHLINFARDSKVHLLAEYVPTDRNRIMNVTYRFAGFEDYAKQDELIILKHPLKKHAAFPDYMKVVVR